MPCPSSETATGSGGALPDRLHYAGWIALALLVVAADQWTKALALANLDYGQPVEILPVFNMTLQYNRGAAFSFLSDAGGWQRWFFTAVALGGAVGNLWDRLQFGHVVDFISLHYHDWYFPTFNVADSAVTVGAGLMILDALLQSRRQEINKGSETEKQV